MEGRRNHWIIRNEHDVYDVDAIYDAYDTMFTIRLHHFGKFTKYPNRQYVGGKMDNVDMIDSDTFSVHEVSEMLKEIGYDANQIMFYHFKKPDFDLDYGLLALGNDQDVINMLKYVPNFKFIDVYVEHGVTTLKTYFMSPNKSGVVIEELDVENPINDATVVKPSSRKRLAIEYVEDANVGGVEGNIEQEDQNVGGVEGNIEQEDQNVGSVEGNIEQEDQNVGDEHEDDENGDNDDDDSEDSDFVPEEHNQIHDVEVDMKDFHLNVDMDVEWIGKTLEQEIGNVMLNEEVEGINFDEFDSGDGSDTHDRHRKLRLKHVRRHAETNTDKVVKSAFYVGQTFSTAKQVKELIRAHAIETRRDLKLEKNDKVRVRVRCHGQTPCYSGKYTKGIVIKEKQKKAKVVEKEAEQEGSKKGQKQGRKKATESSQEGHQGKDKGVVGKNNESDVESKGKMVKETKPKADKPTCPWTLHVSKGKDEDTWMVKTLIEDHRCLQTRELKWCNSTFLAQHVGETINPDSDISGSALQDLLSKQFELGIKRMTAYRAKDKAKRRMTGDYKQQYSLLRDYILELQKTNPNTTVKLEVQLEPNPSVETRVFKRIYICLGALKQGFKAGIREILGLDGAFIKGPYPGQVLTAVGVDPNNGIYPVAYAVVEAETINSWTWFLRCLGEDLDLDVNSNFTFITDRQKVTHLSTFFFVVFKFH